NSDYAAFFPLLHISQISWETPSYAQRFGAYVDYDGTIDVDGGGDGVLCLLFERLINLSHCSINSDYAAFFPLLHISQISWETPSYAQRFGAYVDYDGTIDVDGGGDGVLCLLFCW
nr:hypothetical protein [Tanacetum cinerariifolium]